MNVAAKPSALRVAAFVAFFLSGASSLVFQTLWSRLLQHVFGSSSVAISSVVSVFMAGLGLGAYYFGKRADRIRQPLLLYAWAEIGVGCAGLIIPLLLRSDGWLAELNSVLRETFGAGSALFIAARFLCIAPLLIVPTFLMGSTLPLLARHFVTQQSSAQRASREVGRLYAVNTAGAVAGVFASSFVLLPSLGVHAANLAATCTNFTLAGLVLLIRRFSAATPAHAVPPAVDSERVDLPESPALPRAMRKAAALAFACSGFASLLYEVVWSRALIDTIGGSLYSFALILATFLSGIAGGSAAASVLANEHGRPSRVTSFAAGVLCVLAAAPLCAQSGVVPFAVVATLGSVSVAICSALSRASLARYALVADVGGAQSSSLARIERRFAFITLALPVLLAVLICVHEPDRLTRSTLAVTVAIDVLLVLLLALRARPFQLLIALQLFIAGATFTSELFADRLSLTFAGMVAPLYRGLADEVGTVQAIMCATAALCVLPAALGMGAVFPITLRAWSAGGGRIANEVGTVYAGNTLGSIAGAWLPGFILMPTFGMQTTLHLGLAVNLLVALGLVLVAAFVLRAASAPPAAGERVFYSGCAVIIPWLVAGLCLGTLRPPPFLAWDISKMTLGAFRISLARDVLDEESWGAPDLVYYRDGLSTTVTVERWGRHYSLKNNGKVDASNGDDMPTQIMVSALPLLMHRKPANELSVAVVGFGSGVTVGAALQFPVKSVDVVELERSTLQASRFFADVNHLAYTSPRFPYVEMPRLTVWNDDGRNFLAASKRRYDVIVSEPSNPWLTGVSDLFTLDHFKIAKKKLAKGGIYCQWAQLYELAPENVRTIYRTFASVFRHVVVFSAEDLSSDTILLGSDDPLPLDLERLTRGLADARVAQELERAYVHAPFDVFARVLLANRDEVMRFANGAPLNTDDNARIELAAPRDLISFERYQGYLQTMYAPTWRYGHISGELQGFGTGEQACGNYATQALALIAHGRKREASVLLDIAARGPRCAELVVVEQISVLLARDHTPVEEPALALADAELATPEDTAHELRARLLSSYRAVVQDVAAHNFPSAVQKLEQVPERIRRDLGGEWALLEGYLRYETAEPDDAIERLESLLRDRPEAARAHPELYYFLARSHDALMHFDKAVRNMRVYVEAHAFAGNSPPH